MNFQRSHRENEPGYNGPYSLQSRFQNTTLAYTESVIQAFDVRQLSQKTRFKLNTDVGRATAQAVSRRLSMAAARVRSRVRSCGNCDGQSGTGAGLLRLILFPLTILIPPNAQQSSSSSIIRGWFNRANSGRRTKWTQSHPTQSN
jgi:hypothetical protein